MKKRVQGSYNYSLRIFHSIVAFHQPVIFSGGNISHLNITSCALLSLLISSSLFLVLFPLSLPSFSFSSSFFLPFFPLSQPLPLHHCLLPLSSALIEKKTKFPSYIRKSGREPLQSHIWQLTNGLLNSCAFPHIFGIPSSYMTLQPLPSEFPLFMRKFCFLFYQCVINTFLSLLY